MKALTTVELQALSRRNLNILLAEYPEVGDELKTVARNRASIAKKGKQKETSKTDISQERDFSSIECTANESIAKAPTLISTPPPASNDARYLSLVEKEVNRIVSSISIKIRHDVGLATNENESYLEPLDT